MSHVALTDASGRWFNKDTAIQYADRMDGNGISLATGNEYIRQDLYKTAGRNWVLRTWNQQHIGLSDQYIEISQPRAICWLFQNRYEVSPELVKSAQKLEI